MYRLEKLETPSGSTQQPTVAVTAIRPTAGVATPLTTEVVGAVVPTTVRTTRNAQAQENADLAAAAGTAIAAGGGDSGANVDSGEFLNSDFLEDTTDSADWLAETTLTELAGTAAPPPLAATSSTTWNSAVIATEDSTAGPERVPRVVDPHHPRNSLIQQQQNPRSNLPQQNNHQHSLQQQQTLPNQQKETTTSDNGLYQEINPGQYHEINPGQYHEVNPGQYTEVNPGQYTEVNPGQYEEVHPGQDLKIDDVKVDVANKDQTKIYNVQANVGDYIIGEVGTINVNNGQTLQGVRYTAVDDQYQKHITDILGKWFGNGTS